MTYPAFLLNDRLPGKQLSGSMEIRAGNIYFTDGSGHSEKMSLNGIQLRKGGSGSGYVFFSHPHLEGITICTEDKSVLQHSEIRHDPRLRAMVKGRKTGNTLAWSILIFTTGLLLTVIVSLFAFRGKMVGQIASMVPPRQEQALADAMLRTTLAGKKTIGDTAIMATLDLITSPLVNAVGDTAFRFSFTIVEDTSLNAFALPGGALVIHSGLIEKTRSAEELAGVLGHEISHVTKRHHLRGIISNMGMVLLLRGLLGDMSGVSGDLAGAGAKLSSLSYSRDFEREADKEGLELLLRAGIDPAGMIAFFETLRSSSGRDETGSGFLSTHPSTEERLKRLRKMLPGNRTYKPLQIDYGRFRADVSRSFQNQNTIHHP